MPTPIRRRWQAFAAALALGLSLPALATLPQLSGELALSGWSSNRMLDDRRGEWVARAHLATDWEMGDDIQIRAEAWAISAPERLDGRREDAGLREAFIRLGDMPCGPTLGKRVVRWGKTDGINPVDQLSPINFRRLAPETSDQRTGVWGAHLNCELGAGQLQTHVLDRFGFHQVPLPKTEGVTLVETTPSLHPTIAVRYDVLGSTADWSIAAIDGHDLYPTLALDAATPGVVTTTATGMRLLGGDVAVTRGSHVYRGEVAWVDYQQPGQPLAARRHSHIAAVGQVEWWLADGQALAAGMFVKRLRGHDMADDNPLLDGLQTAQALLSNEVHRTQSGLTVRYARPVAEARGELELFAIWMRPDDAGFLRARYGYAISDHLRISAGFDVFAGPADSYLGNLGDNSLAFAQISYAW